MKIISGSDLSKQVKAKLTASIKDLKMKYNRAPKLSMVLLGEAADSLRYVKSKEKNCAEVGMEGEIHHLPESTSEKELLALIHRLNHDPSVDGILIQLPLPLHIDTESVLATIDYRKDVDGLHPMNAGQLFNGHPEILPCTPKGILSLLRFGNIDIAGKHAVILGRSNLVGNPTAQLLLKNDATVTICHSRTRELPHLVRQADILVLAMGAPDVVTPDMLKPGVVIVDVAMNWVDRKLTGDIYSEKNLPALEKVVSAITPVPGGVGPMTIISLIENTFEAYKKRV